MKDILQVFSKSPRFEIDCIDLFSDNKAESDWMMIALMNLTLSYYNSDSSFDYTWKCFNALYSKIFKEKNDSDNLKALRKDLENNPDNYNNILSYIPKMDIYYLKDCSLREMLHDDYLKKPKNLAVFLKTLKIIEFVLFCKI
ncbi:MAG: hypothetical protein ACOX6Y_03535 [Christensenellales bacterium]|jgi:hypothetical protein